MLTSPRITGEWRNAVCDRLAPGEELVALSDILSYSWYSDGWGEHLGDVGCGFMAVTNINLRFGQWKEQVTKTGFLKREFAFLPEVQNMVTWNHGSVTSLSHTEHGVEHRFGAELQEAWCLGSVGLPGQHTRFQFDGKHEFHLLDSSSRTEQDRRTLLSSHPSKNSEKSCRTLTPRHLPGSKCQLSGECPRPPPSAPPRRHHYPGRV